MVSDVTDAVVGNVPFGNSKPTAVIFLGGSSYQASQ